MKKSRKLLVGLLWICGVTAVFGVAGRGVVMAHQNAAPMPGHAEVKIDNFTFEPQTITVAKGTTVQWTNRDDIPHTVVSDDKTTFKSKALDTDDKFAFTFDKAGTYTYFCSLHPKMTAKVVVE